jgi:hypothetical protein
MRFTDEASIHEAFVKYLPEQTCACDNVLVIDSYQNIDIAVAK